MKHLFVLLIGILAFLTGCEEKDIREPGLLVPKTVGQDPSIPFIAVNNTELHSESFGNSSNPMVVVLHGGPGCDYRSLLNFKAIADSGYYVVFYDQRGSGLSRRENKSSYTPEAMIDDLGAVIAYYRTSPAQKIILLGHSWGAMLATSFINKYPTAIAGAILAEPGGFVWKDILDYTARERDYGITSEALNDLTYLDQFITGHENDQTVMDYKFALYADNLNDNPMGDEGHIPFWRYGALVNRTMYEIGDREKPDWTVNLNQYSAKVLFIYSERNRVYGLAHAQHVSSAYPNVQLARIDGAGHSMFTFQTGWNTSFPIILDYLNEIK